MKFTAAYIQDNDHRAHKYNLLAMVYLKIRQLITNKIYYFEANKKMHSR